MISFQIKIDKKTWDNFKKIVPQSTTMNQAIINLIENQIKKGEFAGSYSYDK